MIYFILIFGFFLRLWNLNQSFWLDEAINVLAVRENSLVNLITKYSTGDFHPPLYHILLWFWTKGFGFTEISTRMLSVLFGIATVFLCFFLLKRIFTPAIGLMTALFLATSPLHIYYSQEARMYAETAFFALLSIYFFIAIIAKNSNKKVLPWIGYCISSIILIYSEYLPFSLILAQNIFIVLNRKKLGADLIKKWFGIQFILLILFTPWIPYLLKQLQTALSVGQMYPLWNQVVGQGSIKGVIVLFIKFIIGRISMGDKFIYGIIMTPIMLITSGLIIYLIKKKWKDKAVKLVGLLFALPILISFLVSFYFSVFSYFRFIFLLPLFYLLVVLGINSIHTKSVRRAVLIFFVISNLGSIIIFNTNKRFWREDWRSAVSFIESGTEKNSIAVMVNPAQNAGYNYYSSGIVPLVYGNDWKYNAYKTVWLIRYVQPIFDVTDMVRQNIEMAGYKKLTEYDFNGVIVWKYTI